ncbi:MAG: S-layer homology domain-containing protein, partial [Dysosmobacter sp.]|nr:S-layer homology domain-containing protein [Dysosmobacter sp.]
TITPSAAQIQNSSGADVADNYNIIYQTGTLTINPSPVTLIFNDQTIVYGSTPAEATATPASAKIEYSYTTEAGGTPTPGWPANAGTYTVTAKVEATGNYGEASETITLTINPKAVSNPTIELSDNSFVYDGTEKKPTIVVKDGEAVIPASEYTVTYSDNTDVGTATVTITNVEGNYTVSGTATFTITAKPLAGASVSATGPFTYTGSALTPDPIVTLGGQTLVKGTDYTVAYTNNTDAGTATITVTGTGNYSGTASGTFAIAKATLTVDGNGTASGTYGAKLSELTVDGLTAKLGAGTVTGTWKLTGDTVPNVGDSGEYTATFTPDSGAGNYNPLTAKVKLNIAKANYTGMTAASTSGKFGAEKTYDLSNLLPSGYELGTPTKTDTNSIFEGEPTLSGAVLTYKLADVETNKGKTGTINVPVTSSTNYEPFNLTITVTVTDKFVPTLAVNPITVTYTGEAVPSTAIKGSATVDGKAVPGIWSFGSGQALTNVADSGTKTVKFVPTDTANYAEATGTVVVTINKATPTGAPKYTAISASGKTLADAGLTTEGGTFSTAGTVAWALADTTEVTANTAYEWVFTPTDTANYNILTGKITLWPYTTPSNPGGGTYVPSGPGSSTLPVTTTGQGSSAVTTTTATPAASTQGGTATTTINTAMGNEIVKQAVANNSETVVIAPKVTGRVTKTEVSIPASTVGQIGSQTNASLTVSTPVADVTIPNGGLGSLSSAGGTVTVTAEQTGNTVELTVTAGGRAVQSVPGGVTLTVPMGNTTPGTVAVLVHENGTREVVRKSVADNGAVTIPLDGSAKLVIVDNSGYFADVPATSWAADAVAFASAHELFNGTAPGRFSPDQPMSRGMLAVVLHNLESNPAQALTGAFADVDNRQWYAGGVSWAAAQGIIGGYGNGTFGPNDNITREQLAVMLWRYAGSPAATERELHFADAYKASDWAAEALRWAVEKGVLNGKGGGILDPGGEATRAETAQMLKNFLENK